jgi:hypothetical protein
LKKFGFLNDRSVVLNIQKFGILVFWYFSFLVFGILVFWCSGVLVFWYFKCIVELAFNDGFGNLPRRI